MERGTWSGQGRAVTQVPGPDLCVCVQWRALVRSGRTITAFVALCEGFQTRYCASQSELLLSRTGQHRFYMGTCVTGLGQGAQGVEHQRQSQVTSGCALMEWGKQCEIISSYCTILKLKIKLNKVDLQELWLQVEITWSEHKGPEMETLIFTCTSLEFPWLPVWLSAQIDLESQLGFQVIISLQSTL